MYLLPSLNLKLRPVILDLKPGTRVVSHAFNMGDWECDQSVEKEGRTAYLWIVPAKVEGTWTWPSNPGTTELRLTQTYQKIEGMLRTGGKDFPVEQAKLNGSHISFAAGGRHYSGEVNGKAIKGTVKAGGKEEPWSAALP